ncbi:MAG TPA: hypothetical protein VHS31_05675 [Tepidisphaeraceae bacterium]|jgi:hypothetical protein|nr:hypothetical protein [Tepidisphaeraceae bacterium]
MTFNDYLLKLFYLIDSELAALNLKLAPRQPDARTGSLGYRSMKTRARRQWSFF